MNEGKKKAAEIEANLKYPFKDFTLNPNTEDAIYLNGEYALKVSLDRLVNEKNSYIQKLRELNLMKGYVSSKILILKNEKEEIYEKTIWWLYTNEIKRYVQKYKRYLRVNEQIAFGYTYNFLDDKKKAEKKNFHLLNQDIVDAFNNSMDNPIIQVKALEFPEDEVNYDDKDDGIDFGF